MKKRSQEYDLLPQDRKMMNELGISRDQFNQQLQWLMVGFPALKLLRPPAPGDGIRVLSQQEIEAFVKKHPRVVADLTLCKFVPASGAASRMFKDLLAYLHGDGEITEYLIRFFDNIRKFAFYDDLEDLAVKQHISLPDLIAGKKYEELLKLLLSPEGLNYQALPKALLKFHTYKDHTIEDRTFKVQTRTALEEHLVEGCLYASNNGRAYLHFTVSPDHVEIFREQLAKLTPRYQKDLGITFKVELSHQSTSTNTLAVDYDNKPYRNRDGRLIFRPGGHGSLLQNLDQVKADVIFIKNVDNVAPDRLKPAMVRYKKALLGLLLQCQKAAFNYLRILENMKAHHPMLEEEILGFLKTTLNRVPKANYKSLVESDRFQYLHHLLNRPLRVCSVIKAQKATGGGPFWVASEEGEKSLQIVEQAQIGENQKLLKKSAGESNYAHITDLICAVKDHNGKKFDLMKFVDPNTGFITKKSILGHSIKVLELPGLWNGSMAHWNTVLVEVPQTIFHPVKTVNDLLADDHQN